ncbi:hypothetical protein GS506_24255 [Rhodococcus hoagii]|nr:hypothetical protein [Prescottella equi]
MRLRGRARIGRTNVGLPRRLASPQSSRSRHAGATDGAAGGPVRTYCADQSARRTRPG